MSSDFTTHHEKQLFPFVTGQKRSCVLCFWFFFCHSKKVKIQLMDCRFLSAFCLFNVTTPKLWTNDQCECVREWDCVCVKVSGCCHQPPPSSHTHISNPVSWVLNQLSFLQCVLSVSHHTKQGDAVQEQRASVCFLSWTYRRGFTPTPWPVTTEIKLNWLGGFSGGKWMQAAYSPCSFFFFAYDSSYLTVSMG